MGEVVECIDGHPVALLGGGLGEVVWGLGAELVAWSLLSNALLELGDLVFELEVLLAQLLVLLLETLGYVLEGDVPFDLALLVLLYSGLEFGELGLFALTESTLCCPVTMYIRRGDNIDRWWVHTCSARVALCCRSVGLDTG